MHKTMRAKLYLITLTFFFLLLLSLPVSRAQIVDRIEEAGDVRVLKFIKPLVNYNGELVEPNPIFEPSDDPNYDYMIKRNYYEVYIKTNPIDVKTIYKNATVGFRNISLYVDVLQLLQLTNFNVSGNQARWDFYYEKTYTLPFIGSYTLYFNISFILTAYTNRLEKQLIIWDSSLPPEIVAILGSLLQYREQLYYYNTNFNPQTKEFDVGVRVEPARLFINSTNGFVEITAFDYTINESEFIVNVDYAQLDNLLQSGLSYPIIIDPTLTYDTSTTVCGDITDANGNLYDVIIVEEGVTLTVCSYTGAGTGYVNFTTTNTRLSRIEIYGNINAQGSGYPGGAGGSVSTRGAVSGSPGQNGGGGGQACGYGNACATSTNEAAGGGGGGGGVKELTTDTTGSGGQGGNAESPASGGSGGSGLDYSYLLGGGGGGGGEGKATDYVENSNGGRGGNGGGAIIIMSPYVLINNSLFDADGNPGETPPAGSCTGGGGGGGGGSIAIYGNVIEIYSSTFTVDGGNGGHGTSSSTVCSAGGGGGGGGGMILIEYKEKFVDSFNNYQYSGGLGGNSVSDSGASVTNGVNGNSGQLIRRNNPNSNLVPPGSPKYSNPSSTVLSDKIKLNVVWNDTVGYSIDTVYAEVATSYNPLTNYTMTLVDPFISASENKGLYEYNYTFNNNEYGCFAWRSYANASDGIWNSTPYYYVYYKKVPTSYYSDWAKRKPVCILTYTNATDFQVKLNITYEAGMNQDYSDLRFTYFYTSNNSEVPIPYFIENYTNNYAIVWIKLPQVRDRYVETVLMYFNNTQATSESNSDNVFIFYDDFNDGNVDLTKWSVVYGSWTEQNGVLTITTTGGTDRPTIEALGITISDAIIEWRMRRVDNGGSDGNWMGIVARKQTSTTTYDGYLIYDQDGTTNVYNANIKVYSDVDGVLGAGANLFTDNVFRNWKAVLYGQNIDVFVYDDAGNQLNSLSVTSTAYASGKLALMIHFSVIGEYDWVLVREYTPTEPKYSLLDAEVTNQPPTYSNFGKVGGNNTGDEITIHALWIDNDDGLTNYTLYIKFKDSNADYVADSYNTYTYNFSSSNNSWSNVTLTIPGVAEGINVTYYFIAWDTQTSTQTNIGWFLVNNQTPVLTNVVITPSCVEVGMKVRYSWYQSDNNKLVVSRCNVTLPSTAKLTINSYYGLSFGNTYCEFVTNESGSHNVVIELRDAIGNVKSVGYVLDVREAGTCTYPSSGGGGGGSIVVTQPLVESCDYDYNSTHYCVYDAENNEFIFVPKTQTVQSAQLGVIEEILFSPIPLPESVKSALPFEPLNIHLVFAAILSGPFVTKYTRRYYSRSSRRM